MKEKFSIKISQEEKDKALLKGLKKGGREQDIETGAGAFSIKGGPHKSKKKYSRKDKHKKAGF
ncbi:MAG: hypothetical protein PHP37_01375 [Patescibacteria group bacterium]|nr:hypothetical protein [Patescibacteria group bacterium]